MPEQRDEKLDEMAQDFIARLEAWLDYWQTALPTQPSISPEAAADRADPNKAPDQ
jgi:hypothetical protein